MIQNSDANWTYHTTTPPDEAIVAMGGTHFMLAAMARWSTGMTSSLLIPSHLSRIGRAW
jgi:hypothetical protein